MKFLQSLWFSESLEQSSYDNIQSAQTFWRQNIKAKMKNTEKHNESVETKQAQREKPSLENSYFYSSTRHTYTAYCYDCRRDIRLTSRVVSNKREYCISCFTNLDDYPRHYHTINKPDFPLFDSKWSAEDELLLLEGLQKYGFGNWEEIAQSIPINKSQHQIQEHYLNTYVKSPCFLPKEQLLSRRDLQGKLIKPSTNQITKKLIKTSNPIINMKNPVSFQKGGLTIKSHITQQKLIDPAEMIGYLPKRGEFQVQYDNYAEEPLAQLQFNEDDSEEDKQMKFRLIDIYNQRLTERLTVKQFVISRKLLDQKQQTHLQKEDSSQQRELHNIMNIFARFSTIQDHQKLIQGILRQKELRRRLKELNYLKAQGSNQVSEIQSLEKQRLKKIAKSRNKIEHINMNKSSQNDNILAQGNIGQESEGNKEEILTKEQQDLCLRFKITSQTYLTIRQTMVRQSVRRGAIEKQQIHQTFKIDSGIIDSIVQFLLIKNEIQISD